MNPVQSQSIPIVVPSARERDALRLVAALLNRSGRTLATQLLTHEQSYHHALMLAELRDQLLSAGMLCEGLSEITD
jgi:hypothetical protein